MTAPPVAARQSIVIKNVYYMLAYAYQDLQSRQFKEVETEEFEHIHDLFAAILSKGIARQLKQGLHRAYILHTDELATLRGKVDVRGSGRLRIARRRRLACEYDELSENNLLNQVLKTTSVLLLRHGDVKTENHAALKKAMLFFAGVDTIEPGLIKWSSIRFSRNNHSYRLLLGICRLVLDGLLMTEQDGRRSLMSFLDDQAMSRLYEKFILEYYRKHWPELRPRSAQIDWAVGDGDTTMLPGMFSDVMLTSADRVLIIDAKYYSKNMQERYERHSVRSDHLYQIFAYVKNHALADPSRIVSGMLLYARTKEQVQPAADWQLAGSRVSAQTLDLAQDFRQIASQLDAISDRVF